LDSGKAETDSLGTSSSKPLIFSWCTYWYLGIYVLVWDIVFNL